MTERKAFKRRVRARMVATGESYARAAAELEAVNPARAADAHPASAVVVALLKSSGLTLDPVAAFGIGGGIGFMYALFRYREVPHPLLTLVCQHHPEPWAPAMLERLEVDHVAVSGRRALDRLWGAGRATVLPIVPTVGHEEQVVLAIPDGERVRLLDGVAPARVELRSAVLDAYAATGRQHPVLALTDTVRLPPDLTPAIARGLGATIDGMTEPVLGNSFDVNFGLRGLRRWAERVADPGRDGWRAAFGESEVWRDRLSACIDREHTAPAAGRPLFARLLRRLGFGAAGAFEQSGQSWRAIAHTARRGALQLDDLSRRIEQIIDLEAAGIEDLQRELSDAAILRT